MQINANSIHAHASWMANSAHNVANVNSQDFKASDTQLENDKSNSVQAHKIKSENNTNLEKEFTNQINIQKGVEANTKAIKTQQEMMGGLLNILV